jgi:hypothetical protein
MEGNASMVLVYLLLGLAVFALMFWLTSAIDNA